MHILFLSRWYPFPPNNGSKLRIYNLLKGLSKTHQITLISFYDPDQDEPNEVNSQEFCRAIFSFPWKQFQPHSTLSLRGYFSQTPRSFLDTYSDDLDNCIDEVLLRSHVDIVIASQIDMAVYIKSFLNVPAIFEELEVGVLYEQYALASSPIQQLRRGLTWWKYRYFLASTLNQYKACTVVSDREAQLVSTNVGTGNHIEVLPNCVDLASYSTPEENPEPYSMIFTGALTFEPNYEAMLWFIQKAYPIIIAQEPQAKLVITGNHADRYLPPAPRVFLAGYVEDIRSLIGRSRCSIVPILRGGGTRLKILEAMALRTPVIATSKGAEGLDVRQGEHLLIADDPVEFANAVLRVYSDRNLREELITKAYNLVREKYDWATSMPRFNRLVERVGKGMV